MSVLRVGVALVSGAMLLAVAVAKARQDGPKKVASLKPAFGLTAAPELITTRIGQIKLKRVPAGEFMMSSNSSASTGYDEGVSRQRGQRGREKEAPRADHALPFYLGVYASDPGAIYEGRHGQQSELFHSQWPEGEG